MKGFFSWESAWRKRSKQIDRVARKRQTVMVPIEEYSVLLGAAEREAKAYELLGEAQEKLRGLMGSALALPKPGGVLGYFDPGSIRDLGDRDLPACLRAVAADLESGQLAGRLIDVRGVGGARMDSRAHVILSVDLAAEVRRTIHVFPNADADVREAR
jgi:hypothetical protein